ncbi:MAG: hypothetical protein M1840_007033 [Geoglossum simile]|nr:MAG: hypothetical protein M1840_007033 [Geoglossum simile]
MASLTIIPYTPVPTKDRYRTSKLTNDRSKEHETKLSTLPVNTPQLQATAVAGNAGDLATHDDEFPLERRASSVSAFVQSQNHSCGQQYLDRSSSVIRDDVSVTWRSTPFYKDSGDTEPTTETESKSGSPRIWGIESEIGDTEIVHNPLKRKTGTGGQGSQDNPWVIPDSDTESDTENWDGLAWKKRKVCSRRRTIDVTDDEADSAEFGSTRVRAGDIHSESDSASDIRGSEGREQAHPSPAALSAYYSALFKSDDRVEAQSVARVGGNGEWGIHGIIGKEVIDSVVYYCVDWQPTMLPLNQLKGARRLIQEFEEKQRRRRKQK